MVEVYRSSSLAYNAEPKGIAASLRHTYVRFSIDGMRADGYVAQYAYVFSLPKYVLAAHLAEGKRVLVVAPSAAEGVAKIVDADASEVLVVGAEHEFPESVQARPDGIPNLPLHDGTVDLAVLGARVLEGAPKTLQALLLDLRRVLAPGGQVIAAVQMEEARVFEVELPAVEGPDFWTLESTLENIFGSSQLFAQMSWQGVALSPVIGDNDSSHGDPEIVLDESALREDASVSHYLMLAGGGDPSQMTNLPCLLVAFPEELLSKYRPTAPVPASVYEEISQLRDALGVRAAKNAALQRTLRDLESQVTALRIRPPVQDPAVIERLNQSIDSHRLQLEAAHANYEELKSLHAELQKSATALRGFSERTAEELATVTDERAVIMTSAEELRERVQALESTHESLGYEHKRSKSELDVLEKLTRDQENALKEAGSREREHRQDWEVARAEVIALRATNEELRDERDEIRREFDELVAIHRRSEHDVRRSREELRIAVRRAGERTREYEVRVEEISHLRTRLEEAQRTLHASEEEVFRLKISQTSARSPSNDGHVLDELQKDRANLRERLDQRQIELRNLERDALATRMEVARMHLHAEQHRREEARLRIELERLREVIRHGQGGAAGRPGEAESAARGDQTAASDQFLGGELDLARGVDGGAEQRADAANSPTDASWESSMSPRETPKSWNMAMSALEEGDEKFEETHAELQRAHAKLATQEEELARLMQSNSQAQSEVQRRRARENTLAKLLEERDGASGSEGTFGAVEAEDQAPTQIGDDGFPVDWPAEARKMIRRLERKIKFGNAGSAKDRAEAENKVLEANVRAVEQAHLLGRLEASSQMIWEMTDAASRGEAKLETSSLELEREREVRQSLLDELEVVRRLLLVEQTRGLERERLLADARTEAAGLSGSRGEGARGSLGISSDPESKDAGVSSGLNGLVDLGAHDAAVPGDADGAEST